MDENNIRLTIENIGKYGGIDTSIEFLQKEHSWSATINDRRFTVLYRNSVTTQSVCKTRAQAADMKEEFGLPVLVVTANASARVMDSLVKDGVSIAETSGNCRISNGELYINVSGCKKLTATRLQQTYTATKLKVIFYLLLDKENVRQPFRHIAERTGVSLSVIKQTIDDLANKKFIIHTPIGRALKNRKGLIELWALHYNQVMKPKLLLARYDFANSEAQNDWRNLALPEGMAWGGEPAACLSDDYLKPELFDIYSEDMAARLLSTGKFRPGRNGRVSVYRKFWIGHNGKTVPDVLTYADLRGVGDSRCDEAAKKLLTHIKDW